MRELNGKRDARPSVLAQAVLGGMPDLFFKLADDFFRKSVGINRKGLREPDAGHFPVSGGGVFAGGMRGALTEGSQRSGWWQEMSERSNIGEPQFYQRRYVQGSRLGNVAEGIAADVAVGSSVREFADADAVEDNPDYASEIWHDGS